MRQTYFHKPLAENSMKKLSRLWPYGSVWRGAGMTLPCQEISSPLQCLYLITLVSAVPWDTWESRSTGIVYLCARWRSVVSFTSPATLSLWDIALGTHWIRGCVGLRANLDCIERKMFKRLFLPAIENLGRPPRGLVATPIGLSRLLIKRIYYFKNIWYCFVRFAALLR
jgi:hypothetical protein